MHPENMIWVTADIDDELFGHRGRISGWGTARSSTKRCRQRLPSTQVPVLLRRWPHLTRTRSEPPLRPPVHSGRSYVPGSQSANSVNASAVPVRSDTGEVGGHWFST